MNQLNSIILEGNIVRKAELSEPSTGFKVCKFPLAVNRYTKTPEGEQREEVSFFDVEAYGEIAETCSKWCDKGQGVRVVGRLKQSRWEQDNQKKSRIYVVAEHVEYKFMKPKSEKDKDEGEAKAQTEPQTVSVTEAAASTTEQAVPQTEEAVF